MISENAAIYRVLDANFNRLREALRVIEEYFRFIIEDENICVSLKTIRHRLTDMEKSVNTNLLLVNRDTATDCFASESRPEEMVRANPADVLTANFKRAQEACRVIEEYSKAIGAIQASAGAKAARFALYELQKGAGGLKKNAAG